MTWIKWWKDALLLYGLPNLSYFGSDRKNISRRPSPSSHPSGVAVSVRLMSCMHASRLCSNKMNRTVTALKQIDNHPSLAIRRRKFSSVRCTTAPWLYNRPWSALTTPSHKLLPPFTGLPLVYSFHSPRPQYRRVSRWLRFLRFVVTFS